jgi:cyclic pyranopterin phosphate synthase
MTSRSSHLSADGRLSMVDVSSKSETARRAVARGFLRASATTRDALFAGTVEKGEALAAARIAGVLAAKRTGELIPLCHPLPITHIDVSFTKSDDGIAIEASVSTVSRTGVEMEALTAVSVAALTLYDMGKSIEKDMVIEAVRLVEKTGGKSGHWVREGE